MSRCERTTPAPRHPLRLWVGELFPIVQLFSLLATLGTPSLPHHLTPRPARCPRKFPRPGKPPAPRGSRELFPASQRKPPLIGSSAPTPVAPGGPARELPHFTPGPKTLNSSAPVSAPPLEASLPPPGPGSLSPVFSPHPPTPSPHAARGASPPASSPPPPTGARPAPEAPADPAQAPVGALRGPALSPAGRTETVGAPGGGGATSYLPLFPGAVGPRSSAFETVAALPAEIAPTRPLWLAALQPPTNVCPKPGGFNFRLITGDAPGLAPEPSAFLSVGWNWVPLAVNRIYLMKIEIGPAPFIG